MKLCLNTEQLRYYLEHELDAAREVEIKTHLTSCVLCREKTNTVRREQSFILDLFPDISMTEDFRGELDTIISKAEVIYEAEERRRKIEGFARSVKNTGFWEMLQFKDVRIVGALCLVGILFWMLLK